MNEGTLITRMGSGRARLVLAAELAIGIGSMVWLLLSSGDGPDLALIPTLVVVVGARFFGKKKGADDDELGKHPVVAFVFKALTTGVVEDADDVVAADFHAYANGYAVVDPTEGDAVALFEENIEYWRSAVPDLSADIYSEITQKDPHKTDSIAVRYVLSGTFTTDEGGRPFEIEAATFMTVVDHRLTEWRVVVDETFFRQLRAAMGVADPD